MIRKFFEFSFNYYQMFYYVLVIGFIIMFMWKKSRIKSVVRQTVTYSLVFVLAFGAASILKEKILLKETIEIVVDYEEGAECTLDNLSFGVFKPNCNVKLQQGVNLIEIPIGINRCMELTSLGQCSIIVKISGEENSYLLEDKGEEAHHDINLYSDTRKRYLLCEMFIKVILIAVLTFAINIAINSAMQFISNRRFENIKYEFIIFAILIVQLVLAIPPNLSQWVSAWYVLNYNDGIGSRLLIGSLINILSPDYVTAEFAYDFVFISMTVLCFLVSFLFGQVIRKAKGLQSVVYYVVFYIANPGSLVYFAGVIGRLEMYSLILCLVCVILFEMIKSNFIKYMITAFGLCMILLIHQGTLFLYAPILMTLILYDIVKEFNVQKAVMSLVILTGGTLLFLYLQIYSSLHYATCDEAFNIISSRTDMSLNYDAVQLEYYSSLGENFEFGQKTFLETYDVSTKVFVAFIMSLPLIIFLVGIWRSSFSKSETKLIKNPQFWVFLTNIAFIPIYVLMCDWGRWTGAFIGVMFFQIAYLVYKNEVGMKKVFESLDIFIKENQFLCIITLVYLSSLEKIGLIFNDLIYKVAGYIR